MEAIEDIVIVGAGIAGLTTSENLRLTGSALTIWSNAWKALDAVGIGDSLRQQHQKLQSGEHEVRCVQRKLLLEALVKELPNGTIRYSSKVVSIEESGCFKLVYLAYGTIFKTKVLIGCDGVNSVVAKWLGFKNPAFVGRSSIRGYSDFKGRHGLEPKFLQFFGNGVQSGFVPCDDQTVYWFFTWTPSSQDDPEPEDNPAKMKQFVSRKFDTYPIQGKSVVENTPLESIIYSRLRCRNPWELLWGNISKGNVCVAGDALHSMTPDLGQGGCSALEDGIVLARCIAETLKTNERAGEEDKRIEMGLKRYSKERRWRSFELVSTSYVVGFIQQSEGQIMNFLRDKILSGFLVWLLIKKANFDCGKLSIS